MPEWWNTTAFWVGHVIMLAFAILGAGCASAFLLYHFVRVAINAPWDEARPIHFLIWAVAIAHRGKKRRGLRRALLRVAASERRHKRWARRHGFKPLRPSAAESTS